MSNMSNIMSKQQIKPSEYTNFKMWIHKDLNNHIVLPVDSFDDATKLFRTLLLSKDHNNSIQLTAHKIISTDDYTGNVSIGGTQTLLKAHIMWNGKDSSNRENYVWTLLEDMIGYKQIWQLIDGKV